VKSPRTAALILVAALAACAPTTETEDDRWTPPEPDRPPIDRPVDLTPPSPSDEPQTTFTVRDELLGDLEVEVQGHTVEGNEVIVECQLRVVEGASSNFMYSSLHVVDTNDGTYEPVSVKAPERAIVHSVYGSTMVRTRMDEVNNVELTYTMDEGAEISHLVYDDFVHGAEYVVELG